MIVGSGVRYTSGTVLQYSTNDPNLFIWEYEGIVHQQIAQEHK
jgi:hypothetical protein